MTQPIGFGLWQITDEAACRQAVEWALLAGYRHFDTAQFYGNEHYLGAALAESGIPRQELYITTKIHPKNFGYARTLASFDESLHKLQTDYVDLLLLHFPVPILRRRSWQALTEIQRRNQARAIGVSNFTVRHIDQLARHSAVVPAVNQVELHVFLQQPALLKYCADHNIRVEAYSPLAHGKGIDNPVLQLIADKHGKTATQIMLGWCVEAGTVPLPKSSHHQRIIENFDIFDFSFDDEDRRQLRALDKNMRTIPNPRFIP